MDLDDNNKYKISKPDFNYIPNYIPEDKLCLADDEKTIAECTKRIKEDKNDYSAYIERGEAKLNLEQFEDALLDFKIALNIHCDIPKNELAILYFDIGKAKEYMEDYEGAFEAYSKAIEFNTDNIFCYAYRAMIFHEIKQDTESAIEDLNYIINSYPESAHIGYYYRAMIKFSLCQYEIAISDLKKSLELNNENESLKEYFLSLNYNELNDYKNTIIHINNAIKIEPDNPDYYYTRATAEFNNKEYEKSLEDFKKTNELHFGYANTINYLAMINRILEKYDESLKYLNISLKINPKDTLALENRAILYALLNKQKHAIKDIESLIEINPDKAVYYVENGDLYQKRGNIKKTIENYEKAISLDENYIQETGYDLIEYYIKTKEIKKAIDLANKWIETYPDKKDGYYLKGIICQEANDYKNAILNFKKAIEINPKDINSYEKIIVEFIETKDYDNCLNYIEKCTNEGIDTLYIKFSKAHIEIEKGLYKDSRKDFISAIKGEKILIKIIFTSIYLCIYINKIFKNIFNKKTD